MAEIRVLLIIVSFLKWVKKILEGSPTMVKESVKDVTGGDATEPVCDQEG